MILPLRRDWELPQSRIWLLQPRIASCAILAPIVVGVMASYLDKRGEGTFLSAGFMVTVAVVVLLIVGAFIDAAIRHFRENRNLRVLLASDPPAEKIGAPRGDWMYAGLALVFCGAVFVMFLTIVVAFNADYDVSLWLGMPAAAIALVSLAFGFGRIERYVVVSRAYKAARAREDAAGELPMPKRPPLRALFIGLAIWIVPAAGFALAAAHLNLSGAFYAADIFVGAFLFFVGLGAIGVYLSAREKLTRWQNARAASHGVNPPDGVALWRGLLSLAFCGVNFGLALHATCNEQEILASMCVAAGMGFALFADHFICIYLNGRQKFQSAISRH